jgi:hypothetical protein
VFWRSFIDFDGLTSEEILARLFCWYFGPSFAFLFFSVFGDWAQFFGGEVAYLGIVLTAIVVWRDAQRARIERSWMWAVLAGLIPLLGWWAYGRRRATPRKEGADGYPERAPALVRFLNPFWRTRLSLVTHLSPDDCAERLNARCVHWTSPSEWFSVQHTRPLQGKATRRGFSLKWRHAMTRPGGLPQASGRFEQRAGATIVRLRLGMSILDGAFVVLWLLIAILVGVPGAVVPAAGAPPGFGVLWLSGWVGVGVIVFTLIRWISRDDDIRLRRLIIEELEAEELVN